MSSSSGNMTSSSANATSSNRVGLSSTNDNVSNIFEPFIDNFNFQPKTIPLKWFKILNEKINLNQQSSSSQPLDFSDVIIPTPASQVKEAIDKSDVAWNELGTARNRTDGTPYDPSQLEDRVNEIKNSIPNYVNLKKTLKPSILSKNFFVEPMESIFVGTDNHLELNGFRLPTMKIEKKRKRNNMNEHPSGRNNNNNNNNNSRRRSITTTTTSTTTSRIGTSGQNIMKKNEIMIQINIYCSKKLRKTPSKLKRRINSQYPALSSQYLFYGSQKLSSLRDVIYCWEISYDKLNLKRRKKSSSNKKTTSPAIIYKYNSPEDLDIKAGPSSLFIEGTFYNHDISGLEDDNGIVSSNTSRSTTTTTTTTTTTSSSTINHRPLSNNNTENIFSKHIIEYLNELPGRVKHIDANENIQCSEKTMEEITFEDLTIRLNVPYVFLHRNGCEHVFTISDVRSFQPEFDDDDMTTYPINLFEKLRHKKFCNVCEEKYAESECHDDLYAGNLPSFYCNECYDEVQLRSSGRNYRTNSRTFVAHPYVHEIE